MKTSIQLTSLSLGIALALASLATPAFAGKPPKPGGGGGNTGGGTIYFTSTDLGVALMNSDGSGKTPLPVSGGTPSRLLHAGHRWFLSSQWIADEFYPNGNQRTELFAQRDDGAVTVQLTTDPELQHFEGNVLWAPGDVGVSWMARRWDLATGQVMDAGIYYAELTFDAAGNVSGLAQQPPSPLVSAELVDDENGGAFPVPDMSGHDWSPDGTVIVSGRQSRKELWLTDLLNGESSLLVQTAWATSPAWSPDGTTIAFNDAFSGIGTIRVDGTNLKNIAKGGPTYSYAWPVWSPTGSHLTFIRYDRGFNPGPVFSVYRSTADGRSKTNLTPDLDSAYPTGWR